MGKWIKDSFKDDAFLWCLLVVCTLLLWAMGRVDTAETMLTGIGAAALAMLRGQMGKDDVGKDRNPG